MIFDEYSARLRSMPMPDDTGADRQLHDVEHQRRIDQSIADVERLAKDAGVSVRREIHPLPPPAP